MADTAPSAARWLVPDPDDERAGRPFDVVVELLELDPRTRLRGRGDRTLRALAARVDDLVRMGATAPSGRPLAEVLVPDPDVRAAVEPTLDLDALLADGPVTDRRHDRTVRLAEAMLDLAAAACAGDVDLHALVAPVGTPRHPDATEVEVVVDVGTEHVPVPPSLAPAITVAAGGWLAVAPVELFLAAARGVLDGRAGEVGGAVLHAWLEAVQRDPGDPWWLALRGLLDVDVAPLLQQAAARAGSDHAEVAGPLLPEMIALRHPLL